MDVRGDIVALQMTVEVRVESHEGDRRTEPLRAIIDTGAERTCIRQTVADGLRLLPFDRAFLRVPGHEQRQERPWYNVRLVFNPGGDEIVKFPGAIGIPHISAGADVLIGMDVIVLGMLSVNGPARNFIFDFTPEQRAGGR